MSRHSKRRKRQEREREKDKSACKNQDHQASEAAKYSAGNNAADQSKDKLNPAKSNLVIVLEFVGSGVFGVLSRTAFSTGSHTWGIWLSFLSLACLGAGFATTMARTFRPKWVWSIYVGLLALSLICVGFWTLTNKKSDVIPGTRFTHEDLDRMFPFGYVIFSKQHGKPMVIAPNFDQDKIHIEADWSAVKIEPDFAAGMADFEIPHIKMKWKGEQFFSDGYIKNQVPMKLGVSYAPGVVKVYNQPVIHIATLSDHQRLPVFVIGFRILPAPEKRTKPN